MKEFDIIIKEATKGMGFTPNSLYSLGKKPNILGSFSLLVANIKGFSSSDTSAWTGIKLMIKNMRWTLKAKKNSHLEVPTYLKDLVSLVASSAAGCRYCQAHTAHAAHMSGVEVEKIQKVWEFQTSDLFPAEEKAALAFALAAATVPNQVTPAHHEELQKHFTEGQITEIVATVALFGFLNRWNDSMATQLEDEPFQFAQQYLSKNWEAGKHRKA
ncbi:MAG: carboxymuconolactone decarboxylase family protein [Bacteroidota bacterium]